MIGDLKETLNYLVNWCKEHLSESKTTGAVVGLSGGIDSAVVLALACRATDNVTAVLMPCHSSKESIARAKEVIETLRKQGYYIKEHCVDLAEAFDSIDEQVWKTLNYDDQRKLREEDFARFVYGALRSCLRAPTLDFVAKINNALVFGTGNRDEDEIFRYYQKRGDGAVDNNPIVCLHKSEVKQLAKFFGLPQSVIDAVPSADLWGDGGQQNDEQELGITYQEIEWVSTENQRNQILEKMTNLEEWGFSTQDKAFNECEKLRLLNYTQRQKDVIYLAAKYYLTTRHKALPPPGPERKNVPGLVSTY